MLSRKLYKDWMAETQRAKLKQIVSRVKPKGCILDIGAGPGFLEELLPSAIATDIDLENLRLVKGLKVKASGDALPFKTGGFDTVFCIDTLHLLKGISELRRVARAGGRIVAGMFCNEHNFGEMQARLGRLFPGQQESFLIKVPQEWETVVIVPG
jgi:SAM-dependent methyltransferase